MKKSTKRLAAGLTAAALSAVLLTGCTTYKYVDEPFDVPGETIVGLTAGFELPHDSGLVDNELDGTNIYDSDLYYLNEVRNVGADPGAMYVSVDNITDSYNKFLAKEQQLASFDMEEFVAKNGTLDQWIADYGNKFYVAVTGANTSLSKQVKDKYGCSFGIYSLYMSDDLNDWQQAGAVDGYAIAGYNDAWYTSSNTWAPEFKRDPVTGLYLMFYSLNTKVGNAGTEYHPTNSSISNPSGAQWDFMTTGIAYSENPTGPYNFITAEDYYSYMVKLNPDGTKVTGMQDGSPVCYYRDGLGHDGEVLAKLGADGTCLNGNGDEVTLQTPPLNFAYHHDEIIAAYPHSTAGRGVFPAIDINPVINSKGEMYIYLSQHVSSRVAGNHVWVIKMKDWVTPEWDTFTHVTTPSISTIYNDENTGINGEQGYNMGTSSEGSINEGTFVIERDGWYYLSYSPFGYGSRGYAVYFAVSNNPYGPFIKVLDKSPIVGIDKADGSDYMAGTGHHSFIQAGDEWYVLYHAFYNPTSNYDNENNFLGRAMGVDKFTFNTYDQVKFSDLMEKQIENDLSGTSLTEDFIRNCYDTENGSNYIEGTDFDYDQIVPIPYGNGPTYSLQPLPDVSLPNNYRNVAPEATIEVLQGNKNSAKYANDGMISYQKWSEQYEVNGSKTLKVKLSWEQAKSITNIMIYNSRSYNNAFKKVSSIVFELAEQPSWLPATKYNGYCYIKDLLVDEYSFWEDRLVRHGSSAMATFNEIKVKSITITIIAEEDKVNYKNLALMEPSLQNRLTISEIYVAGK